MAHTSKVLIEFSATSVILFIRLNSIVFEPDFENFTCISRIFYFQESQRSGYPCLAFSSRAELEDPFGKNEFFSTKFENFRTKIIKSWTCRQSSPREVTGKFLKDIKSLKSET